MTSGKKSDSGSAASSADGDSGELDQPQWANGLKQLYDSVVDEPLPDSFKDLLSKFDDESADESDQK